MSELRIKPLPQSDQVPRLIAVHYLDASAAVKLVDNETGADYLRPYFQANQHFRITSLCLVEALGVLKRKYLRNGLPKNKYTDTCYMLLAHTRSKIKIEEINLADPKIFHQAEKLVLRYKLDISDVIQILAIKHGNFNYSAGSSKTILITADGPLAKAAAKERLRVWNCAETHEPPVE